MKNVIANYINGNLTEAKRLTRKGKFSHAKLRAALREHGYLNNAASAIADYLRDEGSFQAACDAEQADIASLRR